MDPSFLPGVTDTCAMVWACREAAPWGSSRGAGVQGGAPLGVLTGRRRAGRAPRVLGFPMGCRRAGRAPPGAGGPHRAQACREGPPGAGGLHGAQACREGPPGCWRSPRGPGVQGGPPWVLGVPKGCKRAVRVPPGAGGPQGAQACRESPPTLGTHRACREVSWWKVSALISQMRLCWRPLGQRERLDKPRGPDTAPNPDPTTGRKKGPSPQNHQNEREHGGCGCLG